ncbi:MAG: replication associated protein [Microviridae sp. ctD0m35]|nr:MAG: replication associated protein [Microviridae sp. ctudC31]QGH72986.1 MAG: replication associated protein [Microviridae sp. ctD0m35]
MPCYNPVQGYRGRSTNPETGKRPIVFNRKDGYVDLPVTVPCGRCIGCRLERSRMWAVRCLHEASLYPDNCFITLTFSDDHIDKKQTLAVEDFQKFMKRLRKAIHPQTVRFFHCGEYGKNLNHPHHHACLFGWRPPDLELWSERDGVKLYRSKTLEDLWEYGHSTVGDVTFESAAYVARYVTKKITGDPAKKHYGEKKPEYCTMSRRSGIGDAWIKKYKSDVYPDDHVIVNGRPIKVPKFYDAKLELTDPTLYNKIVAIRKDRASKDPNNTLDRLAVREKCKLAKISQLKRGMENE